MDDGLSEKLGDRLAYDTDELLAQLCIGKTKLFSELRSGRLKAKRFGTKLLFLRDDVDAWLAGLPERKNTRAA